MTYRGSVAELRTGLPEAYVTGARSASPPPWLTFGGAGQNRASICPTVDSLQWQKLPALIDEAPGGCEAGALSHVPVTERSGSACA